MVMRMHRILIALPLLLVAGPALAQVYPPPPQEFQLPPELTDPATMQRVAGALGTASQALLNVRIGDMRAALEGREASPRERNETLGDVVRRKDPNFDRDIQREVAIAGPKIGHAMKALNRTLPELERSLAQAAQAIDRATANLPDPTYPRR